MNADNLAKYRKATSKPLILKLRSCQDKGRNELKQKNIKGTTLTKEVSRDCKNWGRYM